MINAGHDNTLAVIASARPRHLTFDLYFYIIGNMETKEAVKSLAALAQDTRLSIFRLLVEQGPEGLPAGIIGEQLGLANATLSFHLKELNNAGLLTSRPEGRYIFYSVDFTAMNSLLAYLTENCCQGAACAAENTAANCC